MFVCAECGESAAVAGPCPRDAVMLAAADDSLLGAQIGSYRIARLLGAGGMGRVYLGVQPMIGSRVAIKVLSEECTRDPQLLERFFSEARAVNLIRHEHIASVMDLALLPDGRPFIVMQFIDGAPLSAYARGGTASIGGVVTVVCEVLSALGAAHAIGIVHRDLKPDNVLITAGGHSKVLDFGIAKLAPGLQHGASPRTQTGALLGTPPYMAPEQILGGAVDARTDLYAAGVVLFECLTGTVPFASDTLFELMRLHLEAPPPSPRSWRPELPPALEQVILRALAKRADDRYASADDMIAALLAATTSLSPAQWQPLTGRADVARLAGPSGFAGAPTVPVSAPTAARSRNRRVLTLAVTTAIAAAIALVGIRRWTETPTTPTTPTTPATPISHAAGGSAALGDIIPQAVGSVGSVKGQTVVDDPSNGVPHHIERTPTYDPKHFDMVAYYPTALALAQEMYPDVGLTRMTFGDDVYPDGHVDLTLPSDTESGYEFRSPAHSQPPPGLPSNAKPVVFCDVDVYVRHDRVAIYASADTTTRGCTLPLRGLPQCTLAQIWARAIAHGATGGNVVASLDLAGDGTWVFELDGHKTTFDDHCP